MAKEQPEFSKYERARILGARALQISMDAPLLMKIDEKDLENLNFDPLKIAQTELDSGVLPITINRPMPEKRDEKLKEIKIEELEKDEDTHASVVLDDKKGQKGEDKEEADETAAVVTEEKVAEAADMKSDEEVEEEVESEGAGEDIGGAEESGSSDE